MGDDTPDLDGIEAWVKDALYPNEERLTAEHQEQVLALVRRVRELEAEKAELIEAANVVSLRLSDTEAQVRDLEAKVKAEQQQHIEHVAAYKAKVRELEAENARIRKSWKLDRDDLCNLREAREA